MYIESYLGLLLEQSWGLYMDPLMFLMMVSFSSYFLGVHWFLLMVNLVSNDGEVLGSDKCIKLRYTDGEVLEEIIVNTMSRWQA